VSIAIFGASRPRVILQKRIACAGTFYSSNENVATRCGGQILQVWEADCCGWHNAYMPTQRWLPGKSTAN
jgi:hypothetical protein